MPSARRRWSRRLEYDYRNNLVREEWDDNPFNWNRWQYDSAGACSLRTARCPVRSSGAGMRLVIR